MHRQPRLQLSVPCLVFTVMAARHSVQLMCRNTSYTVSSFPEGTISNGCELFIDS